MNFHSRSSEFKSILCQFAERSIVQHINTCTGGNNNWNQCVANGYLDRLSLVSPIANRYSPSESSCSVVTYRSPFLWTLRNISGTCSLSAIFGALLQTPAKWVCFPQFPHCFPTAGGEGSFVRWPARLQQKHTLFCAFVLASWILRLLWTFLSSLSFLALWITRNLVDLLLRLIRIGFYCSRK